MEIPQEARKMILRRRLELFSNAPKITKCRICGKSKPNSVLSGSDIASVVCMECKAQMTSRKKKKKTLKGGAGSAKSNPIIPASPTMPNSLSGWLEMMA